MQQIIEEAKALQERIVEDRRWLHQHPELGFELPETVAYVRGRLEDMGYEVTEPCEGGLLTQIGDPVAGPCVLLRADMDALPVVEETGLAFASTNGNMHACGHDTHTAMLLGAAQILKNHESELKGCVKLLFQPDEEGYPDLEAFKAALSDRTAAIFFTNPEDTGIFNVRIKEFTRLAHEKGVLCCYDQANANGLLGIERTLYAENPQLAVLGTTLLPVVGSIERGETPERIIQQFHLEALAAWFADWGAEAMLLGCTHFPYLKDTLAAQTTLPLIDPAEEMVVMLNRQNN